MAALYSVPLPPFLAMQVVKWEGLGFRTINSKRDKTEDPEMEQNNNAQKEPNIQVD